MSSGRASASNFVVQGSILAMASILVRIIGMIYRIPLTGIIGTEGNGYYTSAYNIYTLLLILSSFSMPVAISRIVSENMVKRQYANIERVLKAAFIYATVIGFIMFCILWFGSGMIAEWLQKPYCRFALQALAPTVWIMAYLGILRGYFQGSGTMIPTAVSQILEQILNAVVSVLAAYILFSKGETVNLVYSDTEYSYAFGAAGGAIGTGAGALIALLFFLLLFSASRKYMRRQVRRDQTGVRQSYYEIAAVLGVTMIPILISSTVYNISSVLDDYIFGNVMNYLGRTQEIVRQWGVFGEYHILFNIPVALANALSSSLIPSLTRAAAEHNRRQMVSRIRYAIRFTMLIAIPATTGLCILADPISRCLFPGKDVELLIRLTMVGALAVAFFSLSTISNAILQGLGHMNLPLKHAVISLILHVVVLLIMLFAGLGIYAVVLSNIIFAFSMCVLNQLAIQKRIRYRQDIKKTYLIPAVASLIMSAAAYVLYIALNQSFPGIAESRIGLGLILGVVICAALIVYLAALILLRAFDAEDLDQMPMGGRLKRFVR